MAVQEEVAASESATGLAVINLFMNLGCAVSISASQSIFVNGLPGLLAHYAPGVDASSVINAGAVDIRGLVSVDLLPGLLISYSRALTRTFVSAP